MNLRHAAVLALVGWYLMVPPLDSKGDINYDAPISKWVTLASSDTIAGCKQAIADEEAELKQNRSTPTERTNSKSKINSDPALLKRNGEELLQRLTLYIELKSTANCIATDDPRLKGN
jgi:hypothetical protein